jgi:hypothetical protein
MLRISLCEPIRKPAVSRHQPSAEDQDAPWWERQSARTVSADLLPIISQGDGGARALDRHNKLGLRGVTRDKCGQYRATISINGQQTHLGYFKKAEVAAAIYSIAAEEHFGCGFRRSRLGIPR